MQSPIDRRQFLGAAAFTGLSLGSAHARPWRSGEKLVVGVMGTGGRGTSLAEGFAGQADVEVAYVCDVDKDRAGKAADLLVKPKAAAGKGKKPAQAPEPDAPRRPAPKVVTDFRRILDDKDVDILVVATADHWHAPATILGCSAGKHVYVEKPCSHNPREGEWMVEAARKNKRVVQLGTQRRSWPKVAEGVQAVHKGEIGKAYFAVCRYYNSRPSIGKGKEIPVPAGFDWDLWQGPAPRRPYRDNIHPYHWHWYWHWGTGEIGNNGVHYLDVCRWALGVDYPTKVSSGGGRYHFQDDQETPDTQIVTYDFEGGKSATLECLSCSPYYPGTPGNEIIVYGDKGTMSISGGGYTIRDLSGKTVVKTDKGRAGDVDHLANFLEKVREGGKPNAEIEEGHKSTLLCHLGSIAHRVGRTLDCDPKNGHVLHDKEAAALWGREYEKGWEPKV